jgi:NitT/TauT family transport system ATP-binding protein
MAGLEGADTEGSVVTKPGVSSPPAASGPASQGKPGAGGAAGAEPQGGDAAIDVRDLTKWYFREHSRVIAIDKINFTVRPGEFVSLVGPSGCGKSTILQCIAGLDSAQRGAVYRHGTKAAGPSDRIGYMTQKDNLFPWLDVVSNIAFPLRVRRMGRVKRQEIALEWVERVGLKGFEKHYPHELSGGMAKRAALARVLASSPETILMDEPFGNVDALLRLQLQNELLRIWEQDRRSVLFVTHDLEEAIALSDRVVVLSPRPGRLASIVDIDLPRPRDVSRSRFDPAFRKVHEQLYEATGYLRISEDPSVAGE